MVYGRSIAHKGYLAYNDSEPATGSTSPLWAYLLGIAHLLFRQGISVILAVKVLGVVLHGIMAYLTFRLVDRLTSSQWFGLLAGSLIGASPPLAVSALSGMEVSLGCALSLAGILSYLDRRFWLSGLTLGLAGLTRPEFATVIAVVGIALLVDVFQKKAEPKGLIAWATPILVFAALYVGWDLGVDRRPFPATYYVKARPGGPAELFESLAGGIFIISRCAPLAGGLILAGVPFLVLSDGDMRRSSFLFLAAGFFFLAGNVYLIPPSDPSAYYHIRYVLPSVPLIFIGTATAIWGGSRSLLTGAQKRDKPVRTRSRLLAIVLGAVAVLSVTILTVRGLSDWRTKYEGDCRNIDEVQVALGKALFRGLPDGARVGTVDAGAIRYFGRRHTLDLMGLNTRNPVSPDCARQSLDVLVLMPAWARLSDSPKLTTVAGRKTKDYQVTSNPAMSRQLILVLQSEQPDESLPVDLHLLGRPIRVCLKTINPPGVATLRAKLAGSD